MLESDLRPALIIIISDNVLVELSKISKQRAASHVKLK